MWKKVIAPTVVVSLLWIIAGGVSSYYIAWLDQSQERLLTENLTTIRAVSQMETLLRRIRQAALQDQASQIDDAKQQVDSLVVEFLKALVSANSTAQTQEELALLQEISTQFARFSQRCQDHLDSGNLSTAEFAVELLPLALAVSDPCEELFAINDRLINEAMRRREKLTSRLLWIRTLILVIGPAVGLYLGYRIAAGLRRSISQISIQLNDAAGEMQHDIGELALEPLADLPLLQRQVEQVADRIRNVMQELHQARTETMRSERLAAVGGLAAGVAHELRNPLTSVKLLIQTAVHRGNQGLSGKTLEVVLEEIGRMENTIQSLLDFARPSQLRRTRHDLRTTVQRAIALTEGRANQQRVTIVTSFEEKPVWVDADSDQLHQVFVNLLQNGIESMSEGGSMLVTVTSDEQQQLARASFQDSGTGIAEEILGRLFEPFVTFKERGTGLGLAVSRRIVVEHNGQILAENRHEGGAVFTVELPLVNQQNQQEGEGHLNESRIMTESSR